MTSRQYEGLFYIQKMHRGQLYHSENSLEIPDPLICFLLEFCRQVGGKNRISEVCNEYQIPNTKLKLKIKKREDEQNSNKQSRIIPLSIV